MNIVLGVQWLKTLGPILTDYATLCMQFFHQGCLVELQGENDTTLGILTQHQLRRLSQKHDDVSYFHITMFPKDPPTPLPADTPAAIHTLLTKFAALFQYPQTLPPARSTDLHIHLVPDSPPVNVRPYRYPHYQKQKN